MDIQELRDNIADNLEIAAIQNGSADVIRVDQLDAWLDQLDDPKPTLSGKAWLEKEVEEFLKICKQYDDLNFFKGKVTAWEVFKGLLDQLEEPEVTAEEQMVKELENEGYMVFDTAENAEEVTKEFLELKGYEFVNTDESVVVKKPVIPQFVADWIEKKRSKQEKDDYIIYEVIAQMAVGNRILVPKAVCDYVIDNGGTLNFAKALIAGYEVEGKPRWVVYYESPKWEGKHYFCGWFPSDSLRPNGVKIKTDERVIKFEDKQKAEALATFIDGGIEEADND